MPSESKREHAHNQLCQSERQPHILPELAGKNQHGKNEFVMCNRCSPPYQDGLARGSVIPTIQNQPKLLKSAFVVL